MLLYIKSRGIVALQKCSLMAQQQNVRPILESWRFATVPGAEGVEGMTYSSSCHSQRISPVVGFCELTYVEDGG